MRLVIATTAALACSACFNMPPRPSLGPDDASGSGGSGTPHDGPSASTKDAPFATTDANFSDVNIAFLSSSTVIGGDLGSVAAANAKCMTLATQGGLGGTFVAFLASSAASATAGLGSARGWVRQDGLPFVDTIANLEAGKLFYPITVDEQGNDHSGDPSMFVLTGANADGTAAMTCSDYTSEAAGGSYGIPTTGPITWDSASTLGCNTPAHLYCLDTSHNSVVSLDPAPPTAKKIFISAGTFTPGTGPATADTLCQNEATAASLAGSYVALLATTTASAMSRGAGSLYERPDGLYMGPLTNAAIAPIDMTAAGAYINATVWTGAASAIAPLSLVGTTASTCGNWTDTTQSGATGAVSTGTYAYDVSVSSVTPCTVAEHVYCIGR